jgi:hypothetical protein
MKRCYQCGGKLGLGVKSRNVWNGWWRARLQFCSRRCELTYEREHRREHQRSRSLATQARGNHPATRAS